MLPVGYFLSNPYTSFKAYAANVYKQTDDRKWVASVVYRHSYAQIDPPIAFWLLWWDI